MDEDFLPAEVLQLEPIVLQDVADSILESTSTVAVDSVPLPPATIELHRYSPIPSTSTFFLTTSEPTTDMAPILLFKITFRCLKI
ncbi:hypothetical protein WA026_010330 [Henosepilachna vigintioctopunctata]|uniref:Uncharacterized protein n=1 Tax=Henosepilachna vigintioctopunctata TaxID=420089 RepID=A0AAW1VD26_9CUCU